jgi:tRNA/rRNA methyltransferase
MLKNRTLALGKMLAVAVVEPEFPLNLGYVARCMANFGLSKLFVISPTKPKSNFLGEASVFASHGRLLIQRAQFLGSMSSLRRRDLLLIGTTAIQGKRKSNLTRKTSSLEDCVARVGRTLLEGNRKACIVLGRDTTGLTNEELRKCDFSLTILTGSNYNTLNISHAAALIIYQFSKELSKKRPTTGIPKAEKSGHSERERAAKLFEQLAQKAEFKPFRAGMLRETLSRLIGRSDPSLRETYLLMGLASRALSKIKRLESRP